MPMFRRAVAVTALLGLFCLGARADAEGNGLRSPGTDTVWPRLQGRVVSALATPLWRQMAWDARDTQGLRLESLTLLGDYFFTGAVPATRMLSGFRATSGLIIGTPTSRALSAYGPSGIGRASLSQPSSGTTQSDGSNLASTAPYLGLGYTSASPRAGGWGFSADIGMVAQTAGSAVRFGRMFNGTQTLDDVLRDMRLAPLLNVGVSYSF